MDSLFARKFHFLNPDYLRLAEITYGSKQNKSFERNWCASKALEPRKSHIGRPLVSTFDATNPISVIRSVTDQPYFASVSELRPDFVSPVDEEPGALLSQENANLAGYSPEKFSQAYSQVSYTIRLSSDRSLPIL